MARALDRLFTIEDWLAYEGEPDVRYELVDGRIVAMNPPKAWHGDIANELGRICGNALEGRFPCRVRSQAGIEIARKPKPKAYVADLAVTCEPIDENRPLMAEPRLVIEVVSPSTDRVDKFEKLEAYMGLPTVEEIWLVWSTGRFVLQAVRRQEGWDEPRGYIGRASFQSPVLAATVALADIYRFTPLGRAEEEPGSDIGSEPDQGSPGERV